MTSASLSLFTILILLVSLFVGIIITWFGRRGRKSDDHPHCAACKFDLFGLAAATTACPECGADLARPRAIRIGTRKRRPLIAALGYCITLASIIISLYLTWRAALAHDWSPWKSDSWLVRNSSSANPAAAQPALAELARRIDRSDLDSTTITDLVARALDLQADLAATWQPGWGDIIESAWVAGLLPEDDQIRYANQALTLAPFITPAAPSKWELMTVGITGSSARLGSEDRFNLRVKLASVDVDGLPLDFPQSAEAWLSLSNNSRPRISLIWLPMLAEPGERNIRMVWLTNLVQGPGGRGTPVTECKFETPVLVGPPTGELEFVTDDAVGAAILDRLDVQLFVIHDPAWPCLAALITITDAPVDLSLDITVESGDQRKNLGDYSCAQKIGSTAFKAVKVPGLLDADRVTLVLQSPLSPYGLRDFHRVWFGRLVRRDVPIIHVDSPDDPRLPLMVRNLPDH